MIVVAVVTVLLVEKWSVQSVSEFYCLCQHIFGTMHPNFTKFLCRLPLPVARSSSGGIAVHYVLPVLWMTSYFSIMSPMA